MEGFKVRKNYCQVCKMVQFVQKFKEIFFDFDDRGGGERGSGPIHGILHIFFYLISYSSTQYSR